MQLMKRIYFHTIYPELNESNRLFATDSAPIGDDLLVPFTELRDYALLRGLEVQTAESNLPEDADAVVLLDLPQKLTAFHRAAMTSSIPLYLIALESKIIAASSHDPQLHSYFQRIFTWDDHIVDGKKYIKINYSFKRATSTQDDDWKNRKLCTLISSNKFSSHPDELYSARLQLIEWFEKNHPEQFKLYGMGWDRHHFFENRYLRQINKIPMLRGIFRSGRPSYVGRVNSKKDVLQNYKFAIAYENAAGHAGYITEKIFDCMFAGCIPIYHGAPNIRDYIPRDCFIDRKDFISNEALYYHLINMSDSEILIRRENIKNFLMSDAFSPFSTDVFASTVIDKISEQLWPNLY